MEPTTTPPWRVLDAPATRGESAATEATAGSPGTGSMSPMTVRIFVSAAGAVAFAVLAFVLAFAGTPDGALFVDGGAALPLPGASSEPGSGSDPAVAVASGAGTMVVEIVGAVPRPGVFRLPPGSRVGDLVAAAGGYGARVDTARAERELNLAAALQDGDQVRVPSRDDAPQVHPGNEPGSSGEDGATGASIDLNDASQSELETLPGVGPATAQKIIAAREEAPFTAVEELRTRAVLGEKTFEKVRALVAVR